MLPTTATAVVQTGIGELELRELPIPDIDDDSALLRVEACGICGSDREQLDGAFPTAAVPAIPGHEPLGRIAAIGANAARRWGVTVGDRVAVEPLLSCHECVTCRGGHYERCPDLTLYSFISVDEPPGLWGGYAEYLYLDPRSIVHRVDPDLAPEVAVLFNPLASGFRWGVEIPRTTIGDHVVILGPGQRGLASVIAASMAGAETITVTGLAADGHKLELARRLGATETVVVDEDDVGDRVREVTGGHGADVVVDTTPRAFEPIVGAVEYAAPGARFVLAGTKGHRPVDGLSLDMLIRKEITMVGARGVTSPSYRMAIRAIESATLPLEAMSTHTFPLAEAERAIKVLSGEVPGEEPVSVCLVP